MVSDLKNLINKGCKITERCYYPYCCHPYAGFSPTRPSGPSWSSRRKVCVLFVCPLPMNLLFEASHWPCDHMISLRPLIGLCDNDHSSPDTPHHPLFWELGSPRVFFLHCFLRIWVIRYVLKLILVMFETNFSYVLGEILPKNAIYTEVTIFDK